MDEFVLIPENPKYRIVYRRWVTTKNGRRIYPRKAQFFRFKVKV